PDTPDQLRSLAVRNVPHVPATAVPPQPSAATPSPRTTALPSVPTLRPVPPPVLSRPVRASAATVLREDSPLSSAATLARHVCKTVAPPVAAHTSPNAPAPP